MGDTVLHNDMQALLEQSGWVRKLARRLASGADADEIEQGTWLAALRTRSERKGPLREWLGTIARNLARQQRRSRGRRAEHEERAAKGEELPATVDLLARAELQRTLVGAVMELDEPYRVMVLLRYFENLPPREIASHLGIPVATVRTRLARALERLRVRLDAEHDGNRGLWVPALAPLWPTLDATTPGLGALLIVNAKIVMACVALCAAGAVTWWFSDSRDSAAQRAPRTGAAYGGTAAVAVPVSASLRISGRALDANGRGLGNARILARAAEKASGPSDAVASTRADGSFVIDEGPSQGSISSGSPDFATVMSSRFGPSTRDEVIVVLAPRLDFAGIVVDQSGAALEGAELAVELPEDLRSRFTIVLDHTLAQRWTASAGPDGLFSLEDVPLVDGAMLVVTADGFTLWREPAPQFSDLDMRIALGRPRAVDGVVRGVVVDPSGRPVPAAWVAFGIDTQRTAQDGAFAFRIDEPESFSRRVGVRAAKITALAEGWLPSVYEPPIVDGAPEWPERVTLRLSGEALSITGRVVDAEGEPLSGIRLYVADATLFGAVEGRAAVLETLFAPGASTWKFVESDADGYFVLEGLLDREYVVRAHDPSKLLQADSETTRAGRGDVEIRMPTDQLYPLVAGRVLSLGGEPIRGAEVFPMYDAFRIDHDGHLISTSHGGVEGTTTDENGRFELHDVPKSLVYLRVNGEEILPVEYGRYVEGDRRFADAKVKELPVDRITKLEIQVEARCHMQVELALAALADELCVLDAAGREVEISLFEADGRRDTERHPIHDGRSAMLSVPESGRTLVLFKDGAEVARSAIRLDASKPTVVWLCGKGRCFARRGSPTRTGCGRSRG